MMARSKTFTVQLNTNDGAIASIAGPYALDGCKALTIHPVAVSGAHAAHVVSVYGANRWGVESQAEVTALNVVPLGTVDQLSHLGLIYTTTLLLSMTYMALHVTTAEGAASVTDYIVNLSY